MLGVRFLAPVLEGGVVERGAAGDDEIVFCVGALPVVVVGGDEDEGFVVAVEHVRVECVEWLVGMDLIVGIVRWLTDGEGAVGDVEEGVGVVGQGFGVW